MFRQLQASQIQAKSYASPNGSQTRVAPLKNSHNAFLHQNSKLKTKNLKLLTLLCGKIVAMNLGNKFPWYSAGLHFECLQCGRCCAGPDAGYIWLSRPEIRLIADFLKMPVKELKQKFLRHVGLRMTIVEDPHTRDCVFLQQTSQGRGCAIYEVRPAQCRNWPFWEHNLASPDTWNSTARKCPGINRGQYYSPEQIRDKKKNKKWWRDEKK